MRFLKPFFLWLVIIGEVIFSVYVIYGSWYLNVIVYKCENILKKWKEYLLKGEKILTFQVVNFF